jgi:hypothetical protein
MVERTFLLYGDRGERIVSGAAALAARTGFVEVTLLSGVRELTAARRRTQDRKTR